MKGPSSDSDRIRSYTPAILKKGNASNYCTSEKLSFKTEVIVKLVGSNQFIYYSDHFLEMAVTCKKDRFEAPTAAGIITLAPGCTLKSSRFTTYIQLDLATENAMSAMKAIDTLKSTELKTDFKIYSKFVVITVPVNSTIIAMSCVGIWLLCKYSPRKVTPTEQHQLCPIAQSGSTEWSGLQ